MKKRKGGWRLAFSAVASIECDVVGKEQQESSA